ncbi:MAG: cell division protein FtsQ [Alphaproteobacteria bacterium]|nr:cell division protein FtsQ [Alphaproteobacteria bacterium]
MKRSIFFWLYFVIAIILAVYFAAKIILTQAGKTSLSTIHNIYVSGKSSAEDLILVQSSVGISKGTPIRSIKMSEINKRIKEVPGIKKSAVRLLPNGDIIIKTEFHKSVALLEENGLYYPLSEDGTKINTPSETKEGNVIVFKGNIPHQINTIVRDLSPLTEYIDYIDWIEDRRWNIHTKKGITILLPENNPSVAINKLIVLNQSNNILSRAIKILDMRDTRRILVIPTK